MSSKDGVRAQIPGVLLLSHIDIRELNTFEPFVVWAGHWIVTGQIVGNRLNLRNPYKNLYKPIKPYKSTPIKPDKNLYKTTAR